MGHSASAHLNYGYVLGGGDTGWLLKGAGKYGEFPDAAGYDEDEEGIDRVTQMDARLMVAYGMEDFGSYWADGYYERKKAAEMASGVELRSVGYEYGTLTLIARGPDVVAYAGAEAFGLPDIPKGADEFLAKALKILDLEPTQEKPSWVLSANYG